MSTATPTSTGHRCVVCSKTFKRQVHLKRHADIHTPEPSHRCFLCHAAFRRADVLKRHLRTCNGPLHQASTKRRACNQCVRQKKACDLQSPCGNCVKKQKLCQYHGDTHVPAIPASLQEVDFSLPSFESLTRSSTLEGAISTLSDPEELMWEDVSFDNFNDLPTVNQLEYTNAPWIDLSTINDGRDLVQDCTSEQGYHRYFEFLDKFTKNPSLRQSFDCGTPHDRFEAARLGMRASEPATSATALGSDLRFSSFPDLPRAPPFSNTGFPTMQLSSVGIFGKATPPTMQPQLSSLQWATHRIVLLVKEVVTVKPRNSPVEHTWSSVLEALCANFFSPSNLIKFLQLYWSIWHPNVNFIHRPTFDPTTCKPILLTTMALIGASLSPDPADVETAKSLFNSVEEMVFTDPEFSGDERSVGASGQTLHPSKDRSKMQTLQAAYMVCLIQNWEGTDSSKRRIRRYRFSTVVSAARDIDFSSARHRPKPASRSEFAWDEFIAQEELIRLLLWIFLLDTAFVIFNNTPPRLVITEAKMHMASPDACFQARDAASCFDEIELWVGAKDYGGPMSVLSAVEMIRQSSLTPRNRRVLGYLGPLNLFVLTSSLHSLIFQAQHSLGDPQLTSIRYALHNWAEAWRYYMDEYSHCPPHAMVNLDNVTPYNICDRIGFVRHASEYWLLAKVIADRLFSFHSNEPGNSAGTSRGDNATGRTESEFILSKYDQTSMQQINDLISNFQKVQLG